MQINHSIIILHNIRYSGNILNVLHRMICCAIFPMVMPDMFIRSYIKNDLISCCIYAQQISYIALCAF